MPNTFIGAVSMASYKMLESVLMLTLKFQLTKKLLIMIYAGKVYGKYRQVCNSDIKISIINKIL